MITPSFSITATERVLPKLALDFTTASLDARITFTRTTDATHPATYVNSSGVVTAATNNQPRFDYDPVTLACKGLLIEESRTNYAKYSIDFSNGVWTRAASGTGVAPAIVATNITAPDGTDTATSITFNQGGGTSSSDYSLMQQLPTPGTIQATNSIYMKIPSGTAVIALREGTSGLITLCTLTSQWRRFTVTGTSVSNPYFQLICRGGYGTTATAFTLHIWGAQFEAGAFATSYIPTTTTALTRNADVATMTGTNFSDWFNASEGTFACEFLTAGGIPTPQYAFLAQNAGTTDFIGTIRTTTSSGLIQGLTYVGGADQATLGTLTAGNNSLVNACQSYKANAFRFSSFGTATLSDNTGSVPSVDRMYIGNRLAGDRALNGHMRQLSYWPQQVTSAETQAFSKG